MNLWKDRTGGTLEKAIIWASLLGSFYYAWTTYLQPKFYKSSERQGDILDSSMEGN